MARRHLRVVVQFPQEPMDGRSVDPLHHADMARLLRARQRHRRVGVAGQRVDGIRHGKSGSRVVSRPDVLRLEFLKAVVAGPMHPQGERRLVVALHPEDRVLALRVQCEGRAFEVPMPQRVAREGP